MQWIRHHRRRENVGGGHLLAVTRVRVVQAVLGVLDLDGREVLDGGAVQVDATAGVEREVAGIRHAHQAEAQPVRIVPALTGVGSQEALGGGVGADDQGHIGQAGEDARTSRVQGLCTRGARRVRRRDAGAVPAEGLCEGGTRDVAAVAVADRLTADDQVDVLPVDSGVGERGAGRGDAVLDERVAPLAPRVHADAEDGHIVVAHACAPFSAAASGFQRQMLRSPDSSV